MRYRFLAPALLVVAFGCGNDATGVSASVAGEWLGGATAQAVAITLRFSVQESGSNISGSGTLTGNGVVNCSPGVVGSHTGNSVSLSFGCQGFAPLSFSGSLNPAGTRLQGTLSGSGFSPLGVTFVNQ